MFENTKKIRGFRQFLESKVTLYSSLVEAYTSAIEADTEYFKSYGVVTFSNQVYWLSWHAISLAQHAVAANEASVLLHRLKGVDDNAEVPSEIAQHALEQAFRTTNLNSRSSSASANLSEDSKLAFWGEVAQVLFGR